MPSIEGVVVKSLVTHPDERGFFREVIRKTDPFFAEGFAQLSHSLMHPGVAKAWHIHKTQIDWWYVPIGVLKVALYDARPESPTKGVLQELFMGGEHGYSVLKIPRCYPTPTVNTLNRMIPLLCGKSFEILCQPQKNREG